MAILFKLVFRDFLRHRSMLWFAFLSIAAVCCLVVWFVAGIDTSAFAENNGTQSFFGKYSLALYSPRGLSASVLGSLYERSDVRAVLPAFQASADDIRLVGFDDALRPSGMGARAIPYLVGIGSSESPFEIDEGRWLAKPMECVLGTSAVSRLTAVAGRPSGKTIVPGDKLLVRTTQGDFELTVAGIVEQELPRPVSRGGGSTFSFGFGLGIGGGRMGQASAAPPASASAPAAAKRSPRPPRRSPFGGARPGPVNPSVYVSSHDLARMTGDLSTVNLAYVQLSESITPDSFYNSFALALGAPLESLRIQTFDPAKKTGASRETASPAVVIGQAWSTIGIVIIASVFIIFTTLSMGVSEKVRALAMLRTVGLTRLQVAAYIILEGLCLGLLGWLAGLFAGWFLLTLLVYIQTGLIPVVTLSLPCIGFAFCCSLAGAFLSSLVPAWRATRVSPSESMVRKAHNLSPRTLSFCALAGLLLLAAIPVMEFCLPLTVSVKLLLFSTLGTLFLGAGFLLFFPWMIVLTEKLFSPLVARLFGFHPRFLSNQLSGNQWRTLGTALSLSIGLGLYIAIHVWANSMLSMFTVPDTIPDTLVRFQGAAISDITDSGIRRFPGLLPDSLLRLSVAQPDLDPELRARMKAASAMGSNVVMMGFDAASAFREQSPLLRLRFVEGSRRSVTEAFAMPGARVCVIPETLSVHGKLHVGDRLRVESSPVRVRDGLHSAAPEYVEYTVAGVVDFPWVWLSKCAGVRVSAGRTAAVIFTPYDSLLRDFGALDREFYWFNSAPGVGYSVIEDYMKELAAVSFDALSDGPAGLVPRSSFSGGTLWDSGINKNHVQVSTVESLNNSLFSRSFGVIDTMTRMPLIILILSTIAVINTMMASVRSRQWEMGVLRACGVTRFGLVRMILAESCLIGLCACVMSLAFGCYYAWLATRMVEYAPVFGVISPRLFIPWSKLFSGMGAALLVCFAAGIYPAFSAGLRETSLLLQRRD